MRILTLAAAIGLGACTSISGDLKHDIVANAPQAGGVSDAVSQGLVDAAWNLNEAVRVGALTKEDAAPACLNRIVADLGLNADPAAAPPSFTPRVNGPISGATVLYIRARQLEREAGTGHQVSLECKALIGQIVIDAGRRARDLIPGGGIISRIID